MSERDILHESVDIQKVRADMLGRLAVVTVIVLLASMLALNVLVALQSRDQAARNGALSREVLRTQEILLSCTTPKGQCFRRSQRRTAGLAAGINLGARVAVVAALDCQQRGVVGAKPLSECVERGVATMMVKPERGRGSS